MDMEMILHDLSILIKFWCVKCWVRRVVVITSALLQTSCFDWRPNTFTLVGELPPKFSYWARVVYKPEPGSNCKVTDRRETLPEYNRPWLGEYESRISIDIRKNVNGCRMVVDGVDIKIFARWMDRTRPDRTDSYHRAGFNVYPEYDGEHKRTFKKRGEDTFYGECQWMFRTVGKYRSLIKRLICRQDTSRGEHGLAMPFAIYTLDQLPGATIKMNIRLLDKEIPGDGDTWVEFPNGWKRCLGDGFDDQYGFCRGNKTDFSHFTGPNGEICTIHPGCTE